MFAVIVNHSSREFRTSSLKNLLKYLEVHDKEFELFESQNFEHFDQCLRAALKSKQFKLLLMGGDGSIRRLIELALELKLTKPLGIIPTGATNGLANSLRIPQSTDEIGELIFQSHCESINLGELHLPDQPTAYFHYLACVGISAEIPKYLFSQKKSTSQKLISIGNSLFTKPLAFDVHHSNQTQLASSVAISSRVPRKFGLNSEPQFYAKIYDQKSRISLWKLMLLNFHSTSSTSSGIQNFCADEIVIHTPNIPIYLDGDYAGTTPCKFKFSNAKYPIMSQFEATSTEIQDPD